MTRVLLAEGEHVLTAGDVDRLNGAERLQRFRELLKLIDDGEAPTHER